MNEREKRRWSTRFFRSWSKKCPFFSVPDRSNLLFLQSRSKKFMTFMKLIEKTRDFSAADREISGFFWSQSIKFTIFTSLIDEICDFSKSDRRNTKFCRVRSAKFAILPYVINSWFCRAWLKKFTIFTCSTNEIRNFSINTQAFSMLHRRNLHFFRARSANFAILNWMSKSTFFPSDKLMIFFYSLKTDETQDCYVTD